MSILFLNLIIFVLTSNVCLSLDNLINSDLASNWCMGGCFQYSTYKILLTVSHWDKIIGPIFGLVRHFHCIMLQRVNYYRYGVGLNP